MSIDEAIKKLGGAQTGLTGLANQATAAIEAMLATNQGVPVPYEFEELPGTLNTVAQTAGRLKDSLEKLDDEMEKWEGLPETVESAMQEQVGELEAEVQGLDEVIGQLEEVVGETGPALEASLERAATELQARFQQSIAEVKDALVRLYEATDELKLTYTERLPETLSNTSTQFESVFDNAEEFLQTNFVNKVTDETKQQIAETGSTISNTVDTLESDFRALLETTRQQSDELLEKLQNFGAQWTRKIDRVKDEYESIVGQVQEIGRSVRILMETMDDALSTSGVGLNAVSGVLTDVKGIVDSVM